MKNIRIFLSENFLFLFVKFSMYLNRRVFVMEQHCLQLICFCLHEMAEPFISNDSENVRLETV